MIRSRGPLPGALLRGAPLWGALLGGALLGVVVVLAAGCGDADPEAAPVDDPAAAAAAAVAASANAPTSTTEPGPVDPLTIVGEIINPYDLDNGDCFNRVEDLRAGRKIVITSKIECEEAHMYEVFHFFEVDAPHPSIYPGDRAMEALAQQTCYSEFEAFVGEIYELSVFEIGTLTPTRSNFEDERARYRGIHCWLYRVDGELIEGSVRGLAL